MPCDALESSGELFIGPYLEMAEAMAAGGMPATLPMGTPGPLDEFEVAIGPARADLDAAARDVAAVLFGQFPLARSIPRASLLAIAREAAAAAIRHAQATAVAQIAIYGPDQEDEARRAPGLSRRAATRNWAVVRTYHERSGSNGPAAASG